MTAPPVVPITFQQRRVLGELTRDGASNRVIAERLGITEDTVKSHVKGLLAAFGVRERTALVVLCLRREVLVRTVQQRPKQPQLPQPADVPNPTAHAFREVEPCEPCRQWMVAYCRRNGLGEGGAVA